MGQDMASRPQERQTHTANLSARHEPCAPLRVENYFFKEMIFLLNQCKLCLVTPLTFSLASAVFLGGGRSAVCGAGWEPAPHPASGRRGSALALGRQAGRGRAGGSPALAPGAVCLAGCCGPRGPGRAASVQLARFGTCLYPGQSPRHWPGAGQEDRGRCKELVIGRPFASSPGRPSSNFFLSSARGMSHGHVRQQGRLGNAFYEVAHSATWN